MIDHKTLSDLISQNVSLRLVEPHIYSVYSQGEHINIYDKGAKFYDLVVANRFYNRIMWGYSVKEFEYFCHKTLMSSSKGWVLDVGCGSLVFTARIYANYTERPIVLSDESIQMLRSAKSRLTKLNGCVPANIVLLHADARQLPFNPGSFQTIIAMNILHILQDIKQVVLGLRDILVEDGNISYTTLVANSRLGDNYLKLLGGMGQVVPRTPEQIMAAFDELRLPANYYLKGNMMFIH